MDRVGGQHTPRADGSLTGSVMDRAECRLMADVAKPLVIHTSSVMNWTVLETYHDGTMSCQGAAAFEMLLPALRDFELRGISKRTSGGTCCVRMNGLRERSSRGLTDQL